MARDKGSPEQAPEEFLKECQQLWQKAMALSGEAYSAKSAALEAQLAEATEEARKLREQVDPLVSTRESQARTLVELDKQLKEMQSSLNSEREESTTLQARAAERERQLKEALEDVARVEAKLREAESETLAEAERRSVAEIRVASLESDLQGNVNQAVATVQSDLNKASSKLEVVSAERDRLNRDLADAFETIALLEERGKQAAQQGEASCELTNKIQQLEAEIGALQRKNKQLNSECDEFAEKNAELLKRIQQPA